jgi:peptide/nickel transport system substrate-binding protein
MKHATSNDPWAHDYLKANTAGTGPYILQEYIAGDHVTLVKNPNYWGGWNGPHVDKIYMPEISDSSVQRLRLEQGSLDVGLLTITDALAVKGKPGIVMKVVPTYENYFINMNTQKAPLNNVLVRQALSYMYDYNGTIQTILQGLGTQARGPVPQTLWGWNPEATQYHYNLTKAKELLKQAGYEPGDIKLDYWFQSAPTPTAVAETLQAGAAKCGVTITLHGTTYATLIDAVRPGSGDATKGVDLSAQYWWPDYADPIGFLQVLFTCNNETQPLLASSYPYFNWAYYCNPTVDEILSQVVTEKDYNTRVQMYQQAEDQICNDSPAIFVFDASTTITYRDWVKGYYFNAMYQGTCDFYNIYIEGRPGG